MLHVQDKHAIKYLDLHLGIYNCRQSCERGRWGIPDIACSSLLYRPHWATSRTSPPSTSHIIPARRAQNATTAVRLNSKQALEDLQDSSTMCGKQERTKRGTGIRKRKGQKEKRKTPSEGKKKRSRVKRTNHLSSLVGHLMLCVVGAIAIASVIFFPSLPHTHTHTHSPHSR